VIRNENQFSLNFGIKVGTRAKLLGFLCQVSEIIYNPTLSVFQFNLSVRVQMAKIDDIDLKILTELQKDASISVPRLSKKINVNSSVVYSRIKRLSKRQLIKRFTIDVNEVALGYTVSAMIGLNIDSKVREQILEEMLRMDSIRDIYEVTGRFDLLIKVKAKSLEELHNTVSARIGRLPGVLHTETFIEMGRREKYSNYA
jgi:Lrp/AsnC family transcriptional regulator for asnA, asnC and gidA